MTRPEAESPAVVQRVSSDAAASFRAVLKRVEDRLFTTLKLRVFLLTLLASKAVTLGSLFLTGVWPYASTARPTGCVDFGWIWISAKLALSDPARIFDYASFAKAQADLFGAGNCTLLAAFPYPPTLLLLTFPFGLLPFVTAFIVWNVILSLFFLGAVYTIVRRADAIIGAAALQPVDFGIYLGTNGFLTGGFFGFALLMLEQHPIAAGFFIALLTYKPHFGILIPVALLASRNWRALGSATAFTLVLVASSVVAFGADGWLSFFSTLMNRDANLSPNPPIHILLASIYGILFSAGIGAPVALAAHGAVMLILAAAVWITWRSPIPYPLRAALLCVASLLATPYALFYDFCLLAIAFGFLIRDGLARGFLPGERSTVLFCWLILDLGGVQIGPVTVCMLLLLLLYRRIAVLGQQQQPVPVAS